MDIATAPYLKPTPGIEMGMPKALPKQMAECSAGG
jgi:hypothetical protein